MTGVEEIRQEAYEAGHLDGYHAGEKHERNRVQPLSANDDPRFGMNYTLNDMRTAIERFRRSGASESTCDALWRLVWMEWLLFPDSERFPETDRNVLPQEPERRSA